MSCIVDSKVEKKKKRAALGKLHAFFSNLNVTEEECKLIRAKISEQISETAAQFHCKKKRKSQLEKKL